MSMSSDVEISCRFVEPTITEGLTQTCPFSKGFHLIAKLAGLVHFGTTGSRRHITRRVTSRRTLLTRWPN